MRICISTSAISIEIEAPDGAVKVTHDGTEASEADKPEEVGLRDIKPCPPTGKSSGLHAKSAPSKKGRSGKCPYPSLSDKGKRWYYLRAKIGHDPSKKELEDFLSHKWVHKQEPDNKKKRKKPEQEEKPEDDEEKGEPSICVGCKSEITEKDIKKDNYLTDTEDRDWHRECYDSV